MGANYEKSCGKKSEDRLLAVDFISNKPGLHRTDLGWFCCHAQTVSIIERFFLPLYQKTANDTGSDRIRIWTGF